jgi:hypothetical protein
MLKAFSERMNDHRFSTGARFGHVPAELNQLHDAGPFSLFFSGAILIAVVLSDLIVLCFVKS